MFRRAGNMDWGQLRNWLLKLHALPEGSAAETVGRYAIALGLVIAALYGRLLLDPTLGAHHAFLTFFLALIVANRWCGLGPSLFTLALSLLASMWFFLPPRGTLLISDSSDWIGAGMYLGVGASLTWFGWAVRRAQDQLGWQLRQVAGHRRALAREVLERKEAEAALRQSEQQLRAREEEFRTIFELSAVGQAQVSPASGRFLRVNRRFCQMTGYSEEDLLGMSFTSLVDPGDCANCWESFRSLGRGERPMLETECRYVCKNGGKISVVLAAALIQDAQGRPLRVTAVINDITQRKQAEEAMRETKERLERVLNSITEGYFALDADLRFVDVNRVAEEQIFRRPASELLGKRMAEEYPTTSRFQLYAHYRDVMAEQRPVHLEERSELSGRWYEVHAYPFGDRLEVYLHDVTARKENELALAEAQGQLRRYARELEARVVARTEELRQSLSSMQEFTYTIAHDLRAPLRAAHSFATLLLDHYGSSFDDTGRGFIHRITEAALRMDELIHDLLEYGRVASAEVQLHAVNTDRVVENVVQQIQELQRHPSPQIEVRYPLPSVRGNTRLLSQALLHLLQNALKFVAPGVTPQVRVWTETLDGWVRLSVEDNGIGIPVELQREVFRTFQRLAPAEYGGTGMGLAIVQKAVEKMRGRVGLQSEPGKGSRFWLELPEGV